MFKTVLIDPPWFTPGGGKSKRGSDKHYPLVKTKDLPGLIMNDCTGITVTKEELALIINALCYYVKYSNIDMRQEQSEWIYLTINRLDRILKDGWGSL